MEEESEDGAKGGVREDEAVGDEARKDGPMGEHRPMPRGAREDGAVEEEREGGAVDGGHMDNATEEDAAGVPRRNWKPIIAAAGITVCVGGAFAYVLYKQRALENTLENFQRVVPQPSSWPWPIRLWWK